MELSIGDARLPATLDLPAGPARGALAVLHGAGAGQRDYFCYRHLAQLLPQHGFAVLRHDRRPGPHDIPLTQQAEDAAAAVDLLRGQVRGVPVGVWGWSQGAWAAALTATRHPVDFLVLVSCSGVSPAEQMRYGTAEQLRRNGFTDISGLTRLRAAVEEFQRGHLDRATAQQEVDHAAGQPWFPLAGVNRELPAHPGTWADLDFDPAPVFGRITCPVLLFHGETDAWVPIEPSVAAWQRTTAPITAHRLAGCDHLPSHGEREQIAAISAQYSRTLLDWLHTTAT